MPQVYKPQAESCEKLTLLAANSKLTGGGRGGKDSGLLGTRGQPGWGRGGCGRCRRPGANQGVISGQLEEKPYPLRAAEPLVPRRESLKQQQKQGRKDSKEGKKTAGAQGLDNNPNGHKR